MLTDNLSSYYVVHRDFGKAGHEAYVNDRCIDRAVVISDLATGQHEDAFRVDLVNLTEGTVQDVSFEMLRDALFEAFDRERFAETPEFLQTLEGHVTNAIKAKAERLYAKGEGPDPLVVMDRLGAILNPAHLAA